MQTPITEPWSIELSIRDARDQVASRQDEQVITARARAVPVDPYAAWLQEREPGRHSSAVPA
jgi:hypothetical protein